MEKIQIELKENQAVEFSNGVVINQKILELLFELQWGDSDPKYKKKDSGVMDWKRMIKEVMDLIIRTNIEDVSLDKLFSGIELLYILEKEIEKFEFPINA